MYVLLSVVDVVLTLAPLLGGQSLTEFALGLVLGCLFLAGFNWARTRVFLCAPRGFKGSSPLLISLALMGQFLPLFTLGTRRLLRLGRGP